MSSNGSETPNERGPLDVRRHSQLGLRIDLFKVSGSSVPGTTPPKQLNGRSRGLAARGIATTAMTALKVPDGLAEIERELPLVMSMIARTARWVHPDTFKGLPIWCPDTARGMVRYDAAWSRPLVSAKGVTKVEENIRAGAALVEALGVQPPKPRNWTVCHIWGYDDDRFAGRSNVVQDPRYYSCIGNMTWLPTPLKGFTDAVPQIKECLRVCAFHLYGWACEHDDFREAAIKVRSGAIPEGYPSEWPTADRRILPPGTASFSDRVKLSIANRKAKIRRQLNDDSLTHYPCDAVRQVLTFWKVDLSG